MSWRGVHEAVAVADTGSFTAAADKLNTTVANVSRRVGDLEDHLGVKLFMRTTRQVALHPDGEAYIAQCREALDMLETAEHALATNQTTLHGSIRMTAAVEFGERVVAPAIANFQALHDEVSVDLDLSNNRFDLIEGRYDLAVRIGALEESSLVALKIAQRRLLTCAAPDHLKKFGVPAVPADLKQHNCLRGSARQWRYSENGKLIKQAISGQTRCNSGTAVTHMAVQGLGIAQLPAYYVAGHLKSGLLNSLLPEFEPEPESIWLVHPDNRYVPDRVRALADFLAQHIMD